MSRRALLLVLVALAVGAAAGAVWWRGGGNAPAKVDPSRPAALECPREIDLGTVEMHRSVEAVLPVTNTGGQPLTISDITTSCGCLGARLLPARTDLKPPATVTIPPGERVEIAFPLTVTGVHGAKAAHTIRFQTDAPDAPAVEVRLTFTPKARCFSDPATVALGTITAGDAPSTTISLFTTDERDVPRVKAVVSSAPDRVKVTFVPEPPGAAVRAEAAPDSRRFGRVRVELAPTKADDAIAAQVEVFVEGQAEPALAVPVSARVARPAELLPAVLHLPRRSSAGPVYSGEAVCRVSDAGAGAVALRVGLLPPGITARVVDGSEGSGFARVAVTADPKLAARESTVALTATRGDREHPLSLRVVVEPSP